MYRTTNLSNPLRTGLLYLSLGALSAVPLMAACTSDQTQSSADIELTLADVFANPIDGTPVTLRGEIIQKVDDNEGEYVLTDRIYEITLEIYEEDFSVASGALIEISGEIDLESESAVQHELHPEAIEIDVYQYQVIEPQ